MCIKNKASVFQFVYIFPMNKVLLYAELTFCTHFDSKRIRLCNL